ncbi:MAG TPA: Spy/CpxP family protein refolding chaperone [Bacteroidota bacterium]
MRFRLSLTAFIIAVVVSNVHAQQSSYAGEQQQAIKSLSQKEIDDYLSGAGMGFARAAELNHYPGPRHVMDLAQQLNLTEQQAARTKEIYETMRTKAVELGKTIIEQERLLNQRFADKSIDQKQLTAQTNRIAGLQGQLRAAHLSAHLAMKKALSAEQIQKYDELRGYADEQNPANKEHLHKH